ncbi:MAG: hypothetical protein Q4D14_05540 [Bacteroidales bacterium]|nr:hypothetical protein [Bacteroidales bacterium]
MKHSRLVGVMLLLLTNIFVCSNTQAEENSQRYMPPKNEISIGYGFSPLIYNISSWSYYEDYYYSYDWWFYDDTYRGYSHHWGVPSISYMHHHNTWFAQGAEFVFGGTYRNIYDSFTNEKIGCTRNINYTMLYTARFTYLSRPHVSLYGSASLGFIFFTEDNIFDWGCVIGHLCPIGVSFGGEHLRGFAEIGIGGKGTSRIGLSYTFGK